MFNSVSSCSKISPNIYLTSKCGPGRQHTNLTLNLILFKSNPRGQANCSPLCGRTAQKRLEKKNTRWQVLQTSHSQSKLSLLLSLNGSAVGKVSRSRPAVKEQQDGKTDRSYTQKRVKAGIFIELVMSIQWCQTPGTGATCSPWAPQIRPRTKTSGSLRLLSQRVAVNDLLKLDRLSVIWYLLIPHL